MLAAVFTAAALTFGDVTPLAAQTRPPVIYPDREKVMAEYLSNCYRPNLKSEKAPPPHYADMIDMIKELQKGSNFASALFGESVSLDLIYCSSVGGIAPFSGAAYYGEYGVVGIGAMNPRENKKKSLLHETMHGLQKRYNLMDYNPAHDLGYWLKNKLYGESAALTVEIITAFEQRKNGDDSYWQELTSEQEEYAGMQEVFSAFEAAYSGSRGEGKSDTAALEKAGSVAWNQIQQNPEWVEFYADHALYHYIRLHDYYQAGKKTKSITPPESLPDLANISGRINDQINFTRDALPRTLEDVLSTNPKIFNAYQVANLWQYREIYGAKHQEARNREKNLLLADNPYMELDIRKAVARKQKNDGRKLTAILDEMLTEKKAAPSKSNPPKPTPGKS